MSELAVHPNGRVTFRVRYEDDDVLAVDKPAGMVSTPGVGHQHDTLLNGLLAYKDGILQRVGRKRDFGLLHRLDVGTSGVLLVAKSAKVYDALREAFEARKIAKHYWAVCAKAPADATGITRLPIREVVERTSKYTSRKKAVIDTTGGKPAMTAYRVIDESEFAALIEARPITGRLHQIRVHMTALRAPIVGDDLYANKRVANAHHRAALHAFRLVFAHPVTGEEIDVRSPPPKDLRKLVTHMKLTGPWTQAHASEDDGADESAGDVVGDEHTGVGE